MYISDIYIYRYIYRYIYIYIRYIFMFDMRARYTQSAAPATFYCTYQS